MNQETLAFDTPLHNRNKMMNDIPEEQMERPGEVSEKEGVFRQDNNESWHQNHRHSRYMTFLPLCCRRRWGNGSTDSSSSSSSSSESTGLCLDFYARGHILMSTLFLGPALLDLAQAAADAQCEEQQESEGSFPDCSRIYGFRPTSLLTNIAMASGLFGSLTMPYVGAIVDLTPHRRQVATISAITLAIVKSFEVIVGKNTWLPVAILQVVSGILYNIHAVTAYAYTSELSDNPFQQAKYNSYYNIVLYLSMLAFMLQMFLLSFIWNTDNITTARLSLTLSSIVAMVCFAGAWKYFFHNRPTLSILPDGRRLWSYGFTKICDTSLRIIREYRALKWAILAIMFGEAAVSGFAAITTTYLREVLDMESNEIGFLFLLIFVMGIPGSILGGITTVRWQSPVRSAIICDLGCIVVTSLAALLLTGPEHKSIAFVFSAVWGIGLGWLPPLDTTLFMNLLPTNARVELMGIMMFAAVVLSWLPPLLFSWINELGLGMSWGLLSLNLFFLLSIVCLSQIGDYKKALSEAKFEAIARTPPPPTTTTPTTSNEIDENAENILMLDEDTGDIIYDKFTTVDLHGGDDTTTARQNQSTLAARVQERRDEAQIFFL